MLKPEVPRRPSGEGRRKARSQARRILSRSANGHLHLAMAAALFAVTVMALAIPVARSRSGAPALAEQQQGGAGQGLVSALKSQAEGVTQVLASPGVDSALNPDELADIPGAGLVPQPLVLQAARLAARGAIGSAQGQGSLAVQRSRPAAFTLNENGFVSSQTSTEPTVGGALAAAGIRLRSHDIVSPGPESELLPGMHVYVEYASAVHLLAGGEGQTLVTRARTVGEMLAAAGVTVGPEDSLQPGKDTPVEEGMNVRLVSVTTEQKVDEEPIEFQTSYIYDSSLGKGAQQLVQAGSNGTIRREYRTRSVDGRVVVRELLSESVTQPTNQIVAIGTYVAPTATPVPYRPPAAVSAGPASCPRIMSVYATWYTAASAGGATTATGTGVYKGIVAVDPTIIPLGTRMYIPGYGNGVAADTGGAIKGYKIDLGYGANDVYDWRTRWVNICLY